MFVVVCVNGSCGAVKGYSSSVRVRKHRFADSVLCAVERSHVARGCNPQWQVLVLEGREIAEL